MNPVAGSVALSFARGRERPTAVDLAETGAEAAATPGRSGALVSSNGPAIVNAKPPGRGPTTVS